VKEDVKNRTARISAELRLERPADHHENLRAAFKSIEKRDRSIGFMQVLIMVLLLGTVFGWIYYGNVALYFFAVLFPLYIFLRTRKNLR